MWRAGTALWALAAVGYALLCLTQVLPVRAGWVHYDWDVMGAGLTLFIGSLIAAPIGGLGLLLAALCVTGRPAMRTPARARQFTWMLGASLALGVLGLALWD